MSPFGVDPVLFFNDRGLPGGLPEGSDICRQRASQLCDLAFGNMVLAYRERSLDCFLRCYRRVVSQTVGDPANKFLAGSRKPFSSYPSKAANGRAGCCRSSAIW